MIARLLEQACCSLEEVWLCVLDFHWVVFPASFDRWGPSTWIRDERAWTGIFHTLKSRILFPLSFVSMLKAGSSLPYVRESGSLP